MGVQKATGVSWKCEISLNKEKYIREVIDFLDFPFERCLRMEIFYALVPNVSITSDVVLMWMFINI